MYFKCYKFRQNLNSRLEKMNVSKDIQVKHLTVPRPDVPATVRDKVYIFRAKKP